jgi:P-aminobenzoate N-oxygenase AurF
MATSTVERRVTRLSTVSAARVLEPDEAVPGDFGPGQVLPDDLLFVTELDVELTAEQKAVFSREQVASLLDGGIRLESALMAGFGLLLTGWEDLTDPRVTYLLHEVGEETRHSRLFARMIGQLAPTAVNPFHRRLDLAVSRRIYRLTINHPALLATMVLAGEEIPDLIQRWSIDHPDTDDYLRRANVYHREEEARHIAFAGMLLPEMWARAGWFDRFLVRHVGPTLVNLMLETQMFHPGIYATVGLPAMRTARAVKRTSLWRRTRVEGTRPVLKALLAAAPELHGRVPRRWRALCAVDRHGRAV